MKLGVSLDLCRYLCVLFFVGFVFSLFVWADFSDGWVSFPGAPGLPCGKDTFRWWWQSLEICIKHYTLQLFSIGGSLKLRYSVFFTVLRYSLTGGPGWPWTPFGPLSPRTPFSPCKYMQAVEEARKNRFQMVTQIPMMTNLSPSAPADPVYKTVINTLIKYFYKFCLFTKIAEQHTGSPATPCCPDRPWGPSSPCNNQLINKLQSTQLKWK